MESLILLAFAPCSCSVAACGGWAAVLAPEYCWSFCVMSWCAEGVFSSPGRAVAAGSFLLW